MKRNFFPLFFLAAALILLGIGNIPILFAGEDLEKIEMVCEVFPDTRRISVEATLHLFQEYGDKFGFGIEPVLDSLKVRGSNGKDLPHTYDPASGIVRISSIPKGKQTLSLEYSGVYPEKTIPNYKSVITKDFFQILYRWHPVPRGDRFLGELAIVTPEDMISVSSGILVGEKIERGKRIRYFRSESPMDIPFQVIGGKYRQISEKEGNVKISLYVRSDLVFPADSWIDYCRKTLNGCIDRFGFYPFSELNVVQLPLAPSGGGWGGYQAMSLILGETSWAKDPLQHNNPNFIAHEIVHQYFGGIAAYDDEKQGVYISEGATEFTSAMIVNSFAPSPIIERMKKSWLEELKAGVPPAEDVPMASATMENNPSFLDFAYLKFPLFLSALQAQIGDARLRSIERAFLKKFHFKGAFGLTDFLETIQIETAQDSQVAKIVHSWIYKSGIPAVPMIEGLNLSVLTSNQLPFGASSPGSKEKFRCLNPEFFKENLKKPPK